MRFRFLSESSAFTVAHPRFFALVVKGSKTNRIFVFALQARLRMEIGYLLNQKRRGQST